MHGEESTTSAPSPPCALKCMCSCCQSWAGAPDPSATASSLGSVAAMAAHTPQGAWQRRAWRQRSPGRFPTMLPEACVQPLPATSSDPGAATCGLAAACCKQPKLFEQPILAPLPFFAAWIMCPLHGLPFGGERGYSVLPALQCPCLAASSSSPLFLLPLPARCPCAFGGEGGVHSFEW